MTLHPVEYPSCLGTEEQPIRKIAIDPGFGNFKAAEVQGDDVRVAVTPSVVGIGETDTGLLSVGLGGRRARARPTTITFHGITYLVGPNIHFYARPVERLDFLRLSEGPELRALLYATLWQLVNGGSHRAALMVGLPVEILQDREQAHDTLQALRAWVEGEHTFAVNGQPATVTITQVKAISQPVGAYFAWGLDNAGRWTQSTSDLKAPVAVADIGFNTLDLFAIEEGQVSARFTGGDTLGIRRAAETIARNVRAQYGVEMSLYEVDTLIRELVGGRKPTIYHPEGEANIGNLVRQALDNTAAAVTGFMERHWGNGRRFRRLLLTGGGAVVLREALLRQYPHATILPDPVTANARGLAKYAVRPKVFQD